MSRPTLLQAQIVPILLLAGSALSGANLDGDTFGQSPALDLAHPWLAHASDPAGLQDLLDANPGKLPAEFYDHLQYALPDGTVRVMVALDPRTPELESRMEANAQWLNWYSVDGFYASVTADQLATLLADPQVRFVEPDYPLTYFLTESTIDVKARSLSSAGTGVWSYDGANDALVSDLGASTSLVSGSGVNVAVIDSGIDRTHKDFSGWGCTPGTYEPCNSRIVKAVKFVDTESLLPSFKPKTTEVASGHGTHVAGIVGGNGYYSRHDGWTVSGADGLVFGMAPEVGLISVSNGDSNWAGMADTALGWTNSFVTTYGIKVATNSWGCLGGCSYSSSSTTSLLIKSLYDKGVVVVFASGNDGGTGSGAQLSGYSQSPFAIGVASYNDDTDRLSSFSSRGSSSTSNTLPTVSTWDPYTETVSSARRPDLAAPGENIQSARTLTGGTVTLSPRLNPADGLPTFFTVSPYVPLSGTSMSTPHVAGAAALMFDACPSATPLEIMRAMYGTADPVLKTTGSSNAEAFEVGYGKLDTRGALNDLKATLSSC